MRVDVINKVINYSLPDLHNENYQFYQSSTRGERGLSLSVCVGVGQFSFTSSVRFVWIIIYLLWNQPIFTIFS